ncbi:MAG TPA: hypothetical protein VFN49_11085 [Candidatus Aquilonibacter sp.]|nr:hypothetical protein [Candidatus Aquilonibacter sp.]
MSDTLIPLFGIVFLFGAPVAAWIVSRVLAHQERMEYLRRGMMPPDPRLMRQMGSRGWQGAPPPPPPPGPGLGMVPPMPPVYDDGYYAQNQMRKGVTVTMVGFAVLIGLSFIGYHSDGRMEYGPWLLGGLIPMFVGIAQIINALLNGARFPGMQAGHAGPAPGPQNYQAPPSPPPGGPSAAPPPPGPYAWRPGPTPEIEKKD